MTAPSTTDLPSRRSVAEAADAEATEATSGDTTAAASHTSTAGRSQTLAHLREDVGDWSSRAWTRVRRYAAVVRPLGWVLIIAAIVLWIVALRMGWIELMVAAAVMTVTLLLGLIFLFGRTGYGVDLDLTRSRVVVGERAVGALTLNNPSSRAMLPSEVVLPVGAGRGVFAVPKLAAGAEHEELFAIPTTARGVLSVGPVSVRRGDPLGMFERTNDRRQALDLYVHPRTTNLDGLSLGHLRDLEGLPVKQLERDDVSFHALRDYQPGDDLRHVHWKSTARTGQMMVRQYEQTRRSHFVVALSTHPDEYATFDEFELAVSVAGSVGLRAIRDSRVLDARTQKGVLRAQTGKRFLDELAALEKTRAREGNIVSLAAAVAAHAPDAAVVVLITGSKVDAATLRSACARLPQGVRTLAVVADDALDAAALRRIAEADVLALGELGQLPAAARKVLS